MSTSLKKTVTSLLPYLVVALVVVLAEVGLRLWADSLSVPIVREVRYDQIDWYQTNRRYLVKYFSSATPLVPEFKENLFRKEKKPNTFRVFCLGESSMFGVPYQMTANIPGLLRRQLRNAYPEKEIEVVNWGASAINSNAILHLSKSLAQFDPDLVCVYMGHNEFYGPEGIGAGFIERLFPSLISLKYDVRDLRLVKILTNLFVSKGTTPPDANLMQQVSQGSIVPLESEDAEWVFRNYERNLGKLLEFWKEKSVPVIVSDVTSNMMFPPFIHDELPAGTEESIRTMYDAGRHDELIPMLESLNHQHQGNAFVQYWLGRAKLAVRRWGEARIHLAMARDYDLLKFRAPLKINLIAREISKEKQVPFVSADSLFAVLSPNDIPGDQLFWEHLHPKVNGYYAIARLFFTAITQHRLVPGVEGGTARTFTPYNLDDLAVCWLDEAYGDLSIQHLTGRWPFTNYTRQPAVLDSAEAEPTAIAKAVYERRMVWDEACYETALYFWRTGKPEKARTTYAALIEEYPYNYYAHYMLGSLLTKMGNPEEALRHLDISVKSNPDYPNSRLDAGLLLINQGEFNAAIKILRDALDLTKGDDKKSLRANVLYGLAAANANKEQYAEALKLLDEALMLVPRYTDAIRLKEGIVNHVERSR